MGRLDSWLNCFVPFPAPVQIQQGICCLLVQLRSLGQHSNTFLCALCLPTSQTKNCNSELTQWGDLKIIGLKPVNYGFLGSPAYVGASRAHFQPVPCNCQKLPKSREGFPGRSSHISRTSGAQALRKLLNVLRYLEQGRSGNCVSPVCHTNWNISFL